VKQTTARRKSSEHRSVVYKEPNVCKGQEAAHRREDGGHMSGREHRRHRCVHRGGTQRGLPRLNVHRVSNPSQALRVHILHLQAPQHAPEAVPPRHERGRVHGELVIGRDCGEVNAFTSISRYVEPVRGGGLVASVSWSRDASETGLLQLVDSELVVVLQHRVLYAMYS
jgi:hypothetical protein